MRDLKSGFTLVEVTLFLAVTALLFFGVTLGVRGSIFQQRYNDSVQSFTEFLRNVYSEAANVEHTGTGRSDQAIYGKLVTFGESYDLFGNKIESDVNKVFSYTVVGAIGEIGTGSVINALKDLGINVAVKKGSSYELAGIPQEYVPRWGAGIQTTTAYSAGYNKFIGTLLVVRHPKSGTMYTYFYDKVIEVNGTMKSGSTSAKSSLLTSKLASFGTKEIDICINPLGNAKSDSRRDIRLIKNARNASNVEIINQDSTENRCK